MSSPNRVCIIIVTWNRLEMLKNCVSAAKRHAEGADVLVVDNASTDGTDRWLREQTGIEVLTLSENTGGAGGFAAGMRWAYDHGYDWMWIMDDDVEPEPGCLESLRRFMSCADVIQTAKHEADGTECPFEGLLDPHTMRRRKIFVADVPDGEVVPCNCACFEGLLVNRRTVDAIGYPDADFFIGLDDLFYGYKASEKVRFVFAPAFTLRKQLDKRRAELGGRRFYTSTPTSRYYHVRNYWTVMRYLTRTGAGSWRMFVTYAYEATKALAITLMVERDWKGFRKVWLGVREGMNGGVRYAIDGSFLLREHASGIDRYARETVKALDKMGRGRAFRLIVPRSVRAESLFDLKDVGIVRCGWGGGIIWQQTFYWFYSFTRGLIPVGLCNVAPVLGPGVVCLHDVIYRTRPQAFRSVRGRMSRAWHCFQYWWCAKFAERIVTVSEFSKREIMRLYGIPAERIRVGGNGWEHLLTIQEDDAVFERFPQCASGGYFFVLGSLCEYKNLRWVMRAAVDNPSSRWVVTGAPMKSSLVEEGELKNILFTGYLTDGEVKALLGRCRALVFPSLCEGFGIPPLEALSLGRQALVARRASLPEIYGDAVHYINDPESEAPIDIEGLLAGETAPAETVLQKNTWRSAAESLL